MSSFSTIVVPVDFSETSNEAWQLACELAKMAGSQLHLLHVSPEPLQQSWAVEAMAVDFEALSREWMKESEAKLATMSPGPGIDASKVTRAVVIGVPHARIVEYAAEHDASLIVMGTHGYGPLIHLLLGSVAERVVRRAACPVLTVRHKSLRTAPADTRIATATTR